MNDRSFIGYIAFLLLDVSNVISVGRSLCFISFLSLSTIKITIPFRSILLPCHCLHFWTFDIHIDKKYRFVKRIEIRLKRNIKRGVSNQGLVKWISFTAKDFLLVRIQRKFMNRLKSLEKYWRYKSLIR